MPEQNVDVSKPVDIKVSWIETNRVALIEVKWLGQSARSGDAHFTANYGQARARSGSEQLADYLDRYHVEAPLVDARGYLAVFDGRRRGLRSADDINISLADATFFRHLEIDYDPAILDRNDFAPPVRFYSEAVI